MFRQYTIHGVPVWFDRDEFDLTGNAPLAPPHHVKDGELDLRRCFDGDSYAHAYSDGRVMRYRESIGSIDDLVPGWANTLSTGD